MLLVSGFNFLLQSKRSRLFNVKIFATNIISVPGRFQQSMTLSEDGKEYYYGITDSKNWNYETILCTGF